MNTRGYAATSPVLAHGCWTEDLVGEKVTKEFVAARLRRRADKEKLDQKLDLGGGLTDDTYLDRILEKTRRLFLVLTDIGVASRIFDVIDNSWADEDMPVPFDDVKDMGFSQHERFHSRFYEAQFHFLLQELREGEHYDFAPKEMIPLELVREAPQSVMQRANTVSLAGRPKRTFVRRRISLEDRDDSVESPTGEFVADINKAKSVKHKHIPPVWASYTAKGSGFILTPYLGLQDIGSFMTERSPLQYPNVPRGQWQAVILRWMHCLASGLSSVHAAGLVHGAIRPSNILIDDKKYVAFCDIGSLRSFQKDKKYDATEAYNYSAPELEHAAPYLASSELSTLQVPDFSHSRKSSTGSKDSDSSSSESSTRSFSARRMARRGTVANLKAVSNLALGGLAYGNRVASRFSKASPLTPASAADAHAYEHTELSDVFSLGCVFLDILTFLCGLRPADFSKHRGSKVPVPGRRAAYYDGSFHANLARLESWMKEVERGSRNQGENVWQCVPGLLGLVQDMVRLNPVDRPRANDVRDRLAEILEYKACIDLCCHEGGSGAPRERRMTLAIPERPARLTVAVPETSPRLPSYYRTGSSRSPLTPSFGVRGRGYHHRSSSLSTAMRVTVGH